MGGQVYSVPFAQIPEWIIDADISDRAVRVFAVLNRYANDAGYAFPGRTRMAQRCLCSSASIDRALNELRDIGAITSVQRIENGAIIGNDYWLWPATPSSPVHMGRRTSDATPGVTGDATVGAPVTRQERKPLNESHSSSPVPSSTPGDDNGEKKKDLASVTTIGGGRFDVHARHAANLAYARRVETIGAPASPTRWRRKVAAEWLTENTDTLVELIDGDHLDPRREWSVADIVDIIDNGVIPHAPPPVLGCAECGFSGWHDAGARKVIRCTVTT